MPRRREARVEEANGCALYASAFCPSPTPRGRPAGVDGIQRPSDRAIANYPRSKICDTPNVGGFFEQEIIVAKEAGILDPSVDPVLEAIALASFVDGLAVQMLFLSKGEIKTGKGCADSTVLEAQFGIAPGSPHRQRSSARRAWA